MSDRLLAELRDELMTIRRTAEIALEKLARLGAGFKPAEEDTRVPYSRDPTVEARVRDSLPGDLLPKLTVLAQGDGRVTITSTWLSRSNWGRVDKKVKAMGGVWIKDGKNSRWEVS